MHYFFALFSKLFCRFFPCLRVSFNIGWLILGKLKDISIINNETAEIDRSSIVENNVSSADVLKEKSLLFAVPQKLTACTAGKAEAEIPFGV